MRFPWQKIEKKENPADRSVLLLYPAGQAVWTKIDYAALAKAGYQKLEVVFACVDKIRAAFSGLRWVGYQIDAKDNTEELDRSHELMRLLLRPNPRQGTGRFMGEAISYLLLAGNSYVSRGGPKGGPPRELYNLRPDRMRVIPGDSINPVRGYVYTASADPVPYAPEQILHLKEFHPTDDWYGLSRLEVAAQGIDVLNLSARWNANLLQNDARPPGALEATGDLSDEQIDRIKRLIKEDISGSENAGLPLGPFTGGLKWVSLGFSPKDMDWHHLDRGERLKIASIFNVPPELIGDQENKTYSNYQEARRAFYLDNILPLADWFVDELNNWLAPLFGENILIGFDRDTITAIQDDRSKLITDLKGIIDNGTIDRDEARGQLGWEARGGAFAIPTVSGSVVPLDAAVGSPDTLPEPVPPGTGK